MRRNRIKTVEKIEANKWIYNYNYKIKKSNLSKREKEKLLVPKLNQPFFGRSKQKKPKSKKNVDLMQFNKKIKKPYWKKPKPEIKLLNKLEIFEKFIEKTNQEVKYWNNLIKDLDSARNNMINKQC